MSSSKAPTSLQRLINEPKGKTEYKSGEAFLLHVFWEAPSDKAANSLLDALSQCAAARKDTYLGLYGDAPKLVGQHKQLASAIKKLSVGVSRNAVTADLTRRGIDTAFLDLDLSAELPTSLQGQTPLAVEFTELYLDERAFMEHAGSREYLQAYGKVMDPALVNAVPITMRCGTPNESMVEKILDPILKEQVVSLPPGFSVWKRPRQGQVTNTGCLISIDIDSRIDPILSPQFQESCVWSVLLPHPIRENTVRLMAVFPASPNSSILSEIAHMKPIRGEIHVHADGERHDEFKKTLDKVDGLSNIQINTTRRTVGYFLHDKAEQLVET